MRKDVTYVWPHWLRHASKIGGFTYQLSYHQLFFQKWWKYNTFPMHICIYSLIDASLFMWIPHSITMCVFVQPTIYPTIHQSSAHQSLSVCRTAHRQSICPLCSVETVMILLTLPDVYRRRKLEWYTVPLFEIDWNNWLHDFAKYHTFANRKIVTKAPCYWPF